MTKTLTEQWREGTLDFGYYYVKLPNERPQIYHSDYLKSFTAVKDAGRIEIITPVPSYDELKELKEQRDWYETRTYERAALINKLREQLKEANEVIKYLDRRIADFVENADDIMMGYYKRMNI